MADKRPWWEQQIETEKRSNAPKIWKEWQKQIEIEEDIIKKQKLEETAIEISEKYLRIYKEKINTLKKAWETEIKEERKRLNECLAKIWNGEYGSQEINGEKK